MKYLSSSQDKFQIIQPFTNPFSQKYHLTIDSQTQYRIQDFIFHYFFPHSLHYLGRYFFFFVYHIIKFLFFLYSFIIMSSKHPNLTNYTFFKQSLLFNNYILSSYEKMDKVNEIRQKRDTIRNSLKNSLIKAGQIASYLNLQGSQPLRKNQQEFLNQQRERNQKEKQHPQKSNQSVGRLRRKTSLDIRLLGDQFDMFDCNEVFIFNEFGQMYDLIKKIDEGTQSVVHEAIEKKTGNRYAVKVIKTKEPDIIRSIKTHFRILKNIEHPNVIKAYNLFVNQKIGISHIVLQYCQFPNLRFHLLKNRCLKQTEAAEIITGLLSTVAYIHGLGICHRDIKPQNILFNPSTRQIKLIDFQISKMIKYSNQKLQMMTNTGTLPYKAPEMFNSCFYSQIIDIWAIGIICYEMVTGNLPFYHLYANETVKLIKQNQPKYDTSSLTDLCISFLKKCLQKDPLRRFTAVQALKSPFILKYSSISSSNSASVSPMRRKTSQKMFKNSFGFELNKCFNEDSGLKNTESLEIDNGIRVVVREGQLIEKIYNQNI